MTAKLNAMWEIVQAQRDNLTPEAYSEYTHVLRQLAGINKLRIDDAELERP